MEESDNMNGEERNDEFKIPNLFERFLMDDKNIKYKELIKELKKNLTKEMKQKNDEELKEFDKLDVKITKEKIKVKYLFNKISKCLRM